MKKHLITLLVGAALLLPALATAQDYPREYRSKSDNDFQFRTGFTLEKDITRHLSFDWQEELRLKNCFKDIDAIHSGIGLSFKALDWLKLSAGYTYIADRNRISHRNSEGVKFYDHEWESKHRVNMKVAFSVHAGMKWKFTLRENFQGTFSSKSTDPREKLDNRWLLKSRLTASYKPFHSRLRPYAYLELANTLNTPELVDGNYLSKVRLAVGTTFRVTRRSSFDFFYRFDYNYDEKVDIKNKKQIIRFTDDREYNHILNVSYKLHF